METSLEVQNMTDEVNIFSRPKDVKPIVSVNAKINQRASTDMLDVTPSVYEVGGADHSKLKKKASKTRRLPFGQKNNKTK